MTGRVVNVNTNGERSGRTPDMTFKLYPGLYDYGHIGPNPVRMIKCSIAQVSFLWGGVDCIEVCG
jgi:hypothetical protein